MSVLQENVVQLNTNNRAQCHSWTCITDIITNTVLMYSVYNLLYCFSQPKKSNVLCHPNIILCAASTKIKILLQNIIEAVIMSYLTCSTII